MIRITLDYPPSANRYWRIDRRGFAFVSPEAKAYKANTAMRAKLARLKPLQGAVAMTLCVYRPRRVGDLENRLKVLEDALNGIAYEDDSQITEVHMYRFEDKANPRVEVTLEAR